MNTQLYTLRWHGKEAGPYSWSDIERMLEDNQVCLWHDVLKDGRWIILEDLLKAMAPAPQPVVAKSQSQTQPAAAVAQTVDSSGGPRRTKLPTLHHRNGGGNA